ncbi:MAG: hypothetical protein WC525_06260 [Candidatus Thermoplasmatota archaeon]
MQHVNLIESFQRGMHVVVRFLGLMGRWIVSYPNGIFYVLLIIGAILVPYFATFLLVTMLCWAYGGN